MTLTGIRDIDIEILLKLDDLDIFHISIVNKYMNMICENNNFWYKKIINKIEKTKRDNFSKVKNLDSIDIIAERIREMQKYFGFENLKRLNYFLNRIPVNALYQEYYKFENDRNINIIYQTDINTHTFPKYINREELIYELRRSYAINRYKPDKKKEFKFKYYSFNLSPIVVTYNITFETFQKMGIF